MDDRKRPEPVKESDGKPRTGTDAYLALAPTLQEGKADNPSPTQTALDNLVKNKAELISVFDQSAFSQYDNGLQIRREKDGSYLIRINQEADWQEQYRVSPDGKTAIRELKSVDANDPSKYTISTKKAEISYDAGAISLKSPSRARMTVYPDGTWVESGSRNLTSFSGDGKVYTSSQLNQDGKVDSSQTIIYDPKAKGWFRAPDGTRVLLMPDAITLERGTETFPLPNGRQPGTVTRVNLANCNDTQVTVNDIAIPEEFHNLHCTTKDHPVGFQILGPKPDENPEIVIRLAEFNGGILEIVAEFDVERGFLGDETRKGVRALSMQYTRKK